MEIERSFKSKRNLMKNEKNEKTRFDILDYSFRRYFLEERYFLNKSNSKWVSLGIKPRINGDFYRMMRIVDQRGFYMSFNLKEMEQLFSLLGKVVGPAKDDVENRDCDEFSTKDLIISKSSYSDDVFTITNSTSENEIKLSFNLLTLERLYEIEPIVRKRFSDLNVDTLKMIIGTVFHEMCSTDIVEIEDDDIVKKRVASYLTSLCKKPTSFQTKKFGQHNAELTLRVLIDLKTNFEKFFIELIQYQNELLDNDSSAQPLLPFIVL